ncbi:ABC transporter substrate-binding protein [Cohnella algarum]|uniref:ABC transporter substrate-binding protein n=1 Tax=Cohnella algarum TaxID=2044859 RepID=UPI0019682A0A|nr:ABC transporter substrate-binding protein [Cohnella algarum]MBN2981333.1 ABC transporter substrate-binding protein [Cohnella algarum]
MDGAVGPRETVSIIEVWGHGIVIYGNRWGRGGYNLYNGLELNPPEPVLQHLIDKEPYRTITLEQLPAYAGDRVFLTVYGEGGGAERAKEMKASRIWADLPAVKRGCVYEVDIQRFGAGDPISLSRQLDIQVRLLRTGGRGRST